MTETCFHFNIGKWKCAAVSDGSIIVPDPPPAGASGKPDIQHGQKMDIICLYIDTGKKKILIDSGCGDGFQTTTGQLGRNLEAAGIKRSDIDVVLYTHGHLDHVGGSFGKNGEILFPKARFMAARKEWECWQTRLERAQLQQLFSAARKNCLAIPDRFDLVEDNAQALPGIKLILSPGHTPGNSLLEISSDGGQLLCIGDLVHSQIEFTRPDFYSFLDVDPEQAIRSRKEVFAQVARSGSLIFACHFPFPGLGHIKMENNITVWEPVSKN
jgi:glyoxylase-like metal-dependent hydrolase (beta-lactamase superfamily II)